MTKLMVIGIDAATWTVIEPNLDKLPNLKKFMEQGKHKTITLKEGESVLSPAIWCSMFTGKSQPEHGHKKYVMDGKLQSREDIKADFVWDVLKDKYNIVALQVPFVIPPYNFNCEYTPVGFGASAKEDELDQDTDGITFKSLEILKQKKPDVFIVVYNALDRIQHFHWGEPMVVSWYKKIDTAIGMLEKYAEKIIIISDHGFCAKGEARQATLPDVNPQGQKLKGDHHENAILITKNINYEINEPKDVFYAIMEEMK